MSNTVTIPLYEAAKSVSVALLVGLLIGLDRERSDRRSDHKRLGGVRTFPLVALLGALTSLLVPVWGGWPLGLAFVAVSALVGVAYWRTSARDVGATTEMAALVTFVLGALAGQGAFLLAAALGVVVAVLLVAKLRLETFSASITEEELNATLELAVISAIVLPLLPNRAYGPYGALNPFKLWLVVVLISAVSFAGFVAVRLWGARRGLLVTAVIGALVSSTAVTMSMAARSRMEPASARVAAAGAVVASTIMCVRVFALASAFGGPLVLHLWPPLAAMAAVGVAASVLLLRGAPTAPQGAPAAPLTNPSRFSTALAFALVYGLVGLIVRVANDLFGNKGVVAAAAISAVVDVDAISIALAQQARAAWSPVFAVGVVVAAVMNTWVKGGIAVFAGRGAFRAQVALPLAAMGVVGIVMAYLTHLLRN
ncbi:MAG: DUF4010 domain-containing protein [Deltaproteobacteria bacterium]|nr:DUF4010 domain-containing protein [Deltaproteobacteria bacterium]